MHWSIRCGSPWAFALCATLVATVPVSGGQLANATGGGAADSIQSQASKPAQVEPGNAIQPQATPSSETAGSVTVSGGSAPPATPEELGDSLMAHQRYQAAIEAYKRIPAPSAEVWNKMGIAYQLMFNLENASHCYEQSLKLNPRSPNVLNNLGTIYDSSKEYGDAERMYRRAIKIGSHSAMIYKNLGTNLLAQHKYKKGWEVYKTALEIDPHIFENNASPRIQNPATVEERGAMNYYMAKGCVRAGMNDRAIEYLRMALNEGFISPKKIQADMEFAGLRGIPAFQQLLAAQKETEPRRTLPD
jgi:Tfp pilus assembly protein PilF